MPTKMQSGISPSSSQCSIHSGLSQELKKKCSGILTVGGSCLVCIRWKIFSLPDHINNSNFFFHYKICARYPAKSCHVGQISEESLIPISSGWKKYFTVNKWLIQLKSLILSIISRGQVVWDMWWPWIVQAFCREGGRSLVCALAQSVLIAGNAHPAFGLCFASKISWIHGMVKVGKALQDHWVQALTQHFQIPKYHIRESSKSIMFSDWEFEASFVLLPGSSLSSLERHQSHWCCHAGSWSRKSWTSSGSL